MSKTSPIAKPERFGVSQRDVNNLATRLRQAINPGAANAAPASRDLSHDDTPKPAAPRADVR